MNYVSRIFLIAATMVACSYTPIVPDQTIPKTHYYDTTKDWIRPEEVQKVPDKEEPKRENNRARDLEIEELHRNLRSPDGLEDYLDDEVPV